MNRAFTLVELAIVIVIIGLLVGGVLAGQELIKQAQIRKFIKLSQELLSANNTFYAKYNGIPGDLRNATTFFDATECASRMYGSVPCNSTGANAANGLVDGSWNTSTSDQMRFWVHLGLAKVLKGSPLIWSNGTVDNSYYELTGIGPAGSNISMAGTGSYFNAGNKPRPGPSTGYLTLPEVNYFSFSYIVPGGATTSNGSIFNAEAAYNIDSKIDDGKPLTGKVLGGTGTSNSTFECVAAGEYNIGGTTADKLACTMFQSFN